MDNFVQREGARARKEVNYAVDVMSDEDESSGGSASSEFKDSDYREESKAEVQEDDGKWRAVTIYRQKRDPERVVIFFGGSEYEGLTDKYTFDEEDEQGKRVLRDGDGDEIKHRCNNKGKNKSTGSALGVAKKRKTADSNLILKLPSGEDLNLAEKITQSQVTLDNMEMLRKHCLALEQQKKSAKSFGSLSSSSSSSMATPSRSMSSSSSTITPSAKQIASSRKLVSKKLTQSIKNGLKPLKFFSSYDRVERALSVDDIVSRTEFDAMFKGAGKVTQPTATNKPNSKVIIQQIESAELMTLLGDPSFKGTEWLKGGAPTRGFGGGFYGFGGGGGGFSKGKKLKQTDVQLSDVATVSYSNASSKLTLKLKFCNGSAPGSAFHLGMYGEPDY